MLLSKQRTAALGLALSMALTLVACGGGEGRQAEYLSRAQEHLDAGNLEKARLDVKNALQINDKSAEGRYLMALIEEKEQNWRAVYGNLSTAVELDPAHLQANIKLARLQLMTNNLEEAKKRIDIAFALDASNADVFALKAALSMREEDLVQAEKFALQALELNPGQDQAVSVLVFIYAKDSIEKALAVAQAGVAANPESAPLSILEIKLLESLGKTEDVITAYRGLIEKNPEELSYVASLAEYYVAKFRPDEAEALLRNSIAAQPEENTLKIILIKLLVVNQGAEVAIVELEAMVTADPANFILRDALGQQFGNLGDTTRAQALYEEALEIDTEGGNAQISRSRLAGLALAENDTSTARRWLEEALEIEPENPEALSIRARIKLQEGDFKGAIPDLRRVLRSNPDSVPAMLMLANAQRKSGTVSLAQDNYRKVLELQPENTVALYQSAAIFTAAQDYDRAAANLETLLEQAPGNFQAINLLAGVYSSQERWDDAAALTEILSGNEATSVAADIMAAELALRQGDTDKAINAANRALEQDDSLFAPVSVVMRAYATTGEIDEAIAFGEKYRLKYRGIAGVNNLLARLYLSKQQPEKAVAAFEETIEVSPESIQSYVALAQIQTQMGKPELREKTYERGIAANPSNVLLKTELAVQYQLTGRVDQAVALLEEALLLEADSQLVINNLSALLMDHFPTEENLRRVQRLTQDFDSSEAPALLDTRGWLLYRLGNVPQAINLLKAAQAKGGKGPEYWYHLGMAYHKNGDIELAREQLALALENESAQFFGREEAEKIYKSL